MSQYAEQNRKVLERWDREAAERDFVDLTKLRDQFAMAALPAIIMHPSLVSSLQELNAATGVAKAAYVVADAMLKARG